MSDAPLRVGLVGCGASAGRHARSLRSIAEAELAAVFDLDSVRASSFSATHGVDAEPSLASLLGRADVDAVIVAVPPAIHAEIGLQAVERRKHVLVERPIDADLARAGELRAAAQARGVVLSVVAQNRFHDDVRWLERVVASGVLGRPVAAAATSTWSRDQAWYEAAPGRGRHHAEDGGVLSNQAVHALDLLLWLFGPVAEVSCQVATRTHRLAVEDTAVLALHFASGALGTFAATTSAHALGDAPDRADRPDRLDLRFEHGAAVLEGGTLARFEHRQGLALEPRPVTPADPDALEPLRRQIRDFVGAARVGGAPTVTADEAIAVVALVHAAYAAARSGSRRPVGPVA